MARTYSWALLLLILLVPAARAGDSTSNANPALAVNLRTANTACTNEGELAITTAAKPLRCADGFWRHQGATGVVQYGYKNLITAADIGTIMTLYQACPAGKRPLGGGCVFFAGSGGVRPQALIVNTVTNDFTGYQCTWGPLTSWADDPWPRGGSWAPAEATIGVYCADY